MKNDPQAEPQPHCASCGAELHPTPKMDEKRPFYPCPSCGARVNYYTGEVVPLIDFLDARHAVYTSCSDPAMWTICDCLHIMTMLPEAPDKGELGTPSRLRSHVLLAVYRSAYWPLLSNYAAFRGEKFIAEIDVEKLVNEPEGLERDDKTAIAYGVLRDVALALYHGSKAAWAASLSGFLATRLKKDVAAVAPVGEFVNFSSDEPHEPKRVENMEIAGKTICITGTLDAPRSEYAALIEAAGGFFTDRLTRDVDYLVTGEAVGVRKLEAAEKYGIPVCSLAALKNAFPREV